MELSTSNPQAWVVGCGMDRAIRIDYSQGVVDNSVSMGVKGSREDGLVRPGG